MKLVHALIFAFAAVAACAPSGYYMVGEPIQISNGLRVNLSKSSNQSSWDGEVQTLTLDAEFQSNYRLRIKIYDPNTNRYEVPLEIQPPVGGSANPLYEVQFQNDSLLTIRVIRRSTGTVLFETRPEEKFVFAEQFLSLSWKPASENVYGVGENQQRTFKHDFEKNITWALWGKDQPPGFTANTYGVHPHLTVLENDGNTHAVVIVNSNAQQFSMVNGPTIKYVTIGGILDFYFFLGPSPENTVQQYTEAVGRPPLPPYWGLGFHLCRFGYDTIENMKATVDRNVAYGIPQDVQYADIDVMHKNLDFTYSRDRFAGLPEYIKELKTQGIKFVTIVDPFISTGEEGYRPYELGNEMDVWVKKANGEPVVGKVWPEDPVYFADYSKNETKEWWSILIREFHDLLEYDGLWIDMNDPSNAVPGGGDLYDGCADNSLNRPPYLPPIQCDSLSDSTICPDHVQEAGRHYDVHNLYGWFQSDATLRGARDGTGKRSMILSRSTFLGSGRWVAHWTGDNFSFWDNLQFSITAMLQFNLFGIPFVGADICGFLSDSSPELCQRWQEVGAFYPFARNHNVAGAREQDPAVWGPEIADSSRQALLVRYTLLPYLYTLFFRSVSSGGTVARALWHNYPTDSNTFDIDTQFMWGTGLLISPVFTEGTTSVNAYFPNARVYNYFNGAEESVRGGYINIETPLNKINVHVIGGNVLPTQEPAVNTQISRNNPFGLIVALDESGSATGSLFYDDGDSIDTVENQQYFLAEYEVANAILTSTVIKNAYSDMSSKRLDTIRLLGVANDDIRTVKVNGQTHTSFEKLPSGEVLITRLNLNQTQAFNVSWEK